MSCKVSVTLEVFAMWLWLRRICLGTEDTFINEHRYSRYMTGDGDFSSGDWLLIFLNLNKSQPIRGRLLFVKMLFVSNKELLNGSLEELFRFYPDKHGPYSKVFQSCLIGLQSEKMVEERELKSDNGRAYEYNITKMGQDKIHDRFASLDPTLIKQLSELKRAFINLGFMKVLRYVYQKYPEYTTESIIKEDVKNGSNYY